ncbi:Heat shock protein HSP 90-beta [Coelomomyces lativittatus]|nr:Heat shock protein HSP 90-beta [Coelomomyces lativittatus]
MRKMRRELDRALDTFWEPYQSNYGRLGSDRSQCASPLTDLVETDKEYRYLIELPGLTKDKVNLESRENRILVSGEYPSTTSTKTGKSSGAEAGASGQEEEKPRTHLKERWCGKFSRELALPKDGDAQNIRAVMEQGILTLTIPKMEPEKTGARVISIS